MISNVGQWRWEQFDTIASTNDLAKDKSADFDGSPVVYTAKVQTAGRGRRGRSWVSAEGNLFMSQLLKTDLAVSDMVFITSLSIAQTIETLTKGVQINIKWPNDVLLGGKKVCGILIESAANVAVVIGAGVNLVSSPPDGDVMYPACNLLSLGHQISISRFLSEYLRHFDGNVEICSKDGFGTIRRQWLKYAHRLGQMIKIVQKDKVKEGIFKGIDEQGLLLLEQGSGIVKVAVGDVFA